ncbi:MAG: type I secretion system permease/ATPase [Burkholderiales bacterium]|nr:type I secretion system permease/ATPase [Burkholderiales bacterium]
MTTTSLMTPDDVLRDNPVAAFPAVGPAFGTPLPPDPYEACLRFLLEAHGRPLSAAALHALVPQPRGAWRQADFIDAIESLGFATRSAEVAGVPVPPIGQPALLIDSADEPNVLIGPAGSLEADRWEVYLSSTGKTVELTGAEVLARSGGNVLHVVPPERVPAGAAACARGRHGHWFWGPNLLARPLLARAVIASVVTSVFALASSVFTMIVYDRVIPNNAIDTLWAMLFGVTIVFASDFAIRTVRGYFLDVAGSRADVAIADAIFDQVLDLDMRTQRGSTGALASVLREYESIRDFATSATMSTLIDIPFALVFILVLYWIGGPMAWVPVIAIPLIVAAGLLLQPRLKQQSQVSQDDSQTKQAVLVETLAGLETIKALGAGAVMRMRWQTVVTHQARLGMQSRLLGLLAGNWANLVMMVSQVAVVTVGVYLAAKGQVGSGAIVAASILCGRAVQPLAQLSQLLIRLNQSMASYRSLARVMAMPREHGPDHLTMAHDKLGGSIELREVSFTYPGSDDPVLDKVSLRIAAGERVAIIGRVGSGKSTLVKMLLGLHRPDEGQLLVGGVDVRQIDPADLRRNVGSVLQDVWLMTGTVRQNIALGGLRPSDDEVRHAAVLAGADEFIARHPKGYQMRIGEQGEGLSGGQRQAVAVARGLIGGAPILVLDEPTSAMDPAAERALLDRLRAPLKGKTVVLVTHKPSMLDLVDTVIVLDGGRIVAHGPKDRVMRSQSTTPVHKEAA